MGLAWLNLTCMWICALDNNVPGNPSMTPRILNPQKEKRIQLQLQLASIAACSLSPFHPVWARERVGGVQNNTCSCSSRAIYPVSYQKQWLYTVTTLQWRCSAAFLRCVCVFNRTWSLSLHTSHSRKHLQMHLFTCASWNSYYTLTHTHSFFLLWPAQLVPC